MKPHRKAMTLVELCIGMTLTAVIAGALAAFSGAVAHQWRHSDRRNYLNVSTQQSLHVMGQIIQGARGIAGVSSTYQPTLYLWQSDAYGGEADGATQFSETALFEYDQDTRSIYYYEGDVALATSLVTSLAGTLLSPVLGADAEIMELFKTQTWLKPRRTILGPGREVPEDLEITVVNRVAFSVTGTSEIPAVRIELDVSRGDEQLTLTEVFALKGKSKG